MPARKLSVLVVGLDGATFDLILPWADEGYLPNLKRLIGDGARSCLESTIPPITPCAWSSFITGKNPGKHGLFDFIEPSADGHGFRFTNASFRDGESLWACLSRHGRRVGVVNVPITYPPEPVNGFLISGLDTPHEHSPFMHPVEVRQILKDAGIRYRIDQQHLGNMRTNERRRRQLEGIFDGETARTAAFRHLSSLRHCDFRMIVYGATDQVQHHFWHFMDDNHDKFDAAGAREFQHAIRDTYQHVDVQLGQLLDECDESTVVIVMSDHGFGPMSNVRLRLNQVLREAGLLNFVESTARSKWKQAFAAAADRLLRSTLSSDMKRTIAGLFPRLRVWFEGLDETPIDWSKTHAHVNEAYRSSPAVWLSQRNGSFNGERLELREQVEDALRALVDPATGKQLISNCYRPAEIYHGPHTGKAPEILPSWWEDGFLLEHSRPGKNALPSVERSTSPLEGGVEFAASHRLDGVLIMHGGPVRSGFTFSDAKIVDVAPTVLYLLGLPVPEDMDGRVLTEAIDDEFVADNPISIERLDDELEEDGAFDGRHGFTDEESEMIARRLQALGYIQ